MSDAWMPECVIPRANGDAKSVNMVPVPGDGEIMTSSSGVEPGKDIDLPPDMASQHSTQLDNLDSHTTVESWYLDVNRKIIK